MSLPKINDHNTSVIWLKIHVTPDIFIVKNSEMQNTKYARFSNTIMQPNGFWVFIAHI